MLSCTVKIPGKVMLGGEYSVLINQQALACTVNHYLNIEVKESEQEGISIVSDLWGNTTMLLTKTEETSFLDKVFQPAFIAAFHA